MEGFLMLLGVPQWFFYESLYIFRLPEAALSGSLFVVYSPP